MPDSKKKDAKQPTPQSLTNGIRAVAERAKVSPATVSRVMNGQTTVDRKLAKRVRAAIEEMGYLPNPEARALGSGRSRVLGLAISEITNPFFPELVQCFETLAAKGDYELLLGSVIHNDAHAKQFMRRLVQRRVEGVAVMTFRAESDYLRELIAHKIPFVTIDSGVNSPLSLVIEPDYESGIDEAVQHLAVLGHRRVGFIRGPAEHKTNELRLQAFLKSAARAGLPSDSALLFSGDHTFEAGAAAAEYFMGLEKRPTAIMSANDLMAVGVLRVLADRGMNVPGEISVVGFDDIHLAQFVHPPLSTVRMPRDELAAAAFQGLMQLSRQDASDKTALRVKTRLVVRQSTASPRAAAAR